MAIHYMGKYIHGETQLPNKPHRPGATAFREFDTMEELARMLGIASVVLTFGLLVVYVLRGGFSAVMLQTTQIAGGALAAVIVILPHEFLHALCFREDCYIYTNLSQGMLFVFGPEDMSKARFILMSLLPNIVFGFLPYMIALVNPAYVLFGILGALALGSGIGDFYNVKNAITQVPRGGLIYLYDIHTYWYRPEA